jgi:hypothetical protein
MKQSEAILALVEFMTARVKFWNIKNCRHEFKHRVSLRYTRPFEDYAHECTIGYQPLDRPRELPQGEL